MFSRLTRFAALGFAPLLAACIATPGAGSDESIGTSEAALTLSASETAAVLDLVNYPGTDVTVLDLAAGLDSRAAKNILAHRNGADGVSPSADDNLFDTIQELDAISYVGDSALTHLRDYAAAHPAPSGELVETVAFKGWEVEAVLWGVNHLSAADLKGVGLTTKAANNVAAHVPYANVAAVGAVSDIGPSALTHLHGQAASFWSAMHGTSTLVGTYDGVAFDTATAEAALQIAGLATAAQLKAAGVSTTAANHLIASRPYTTLAGVSATSGVGAATMQKLHDFATSGAWTAPAPPGKEPGAGAGCLWDIPTTDAPIVTTYADAIDAYDTRDPMYHFGVQAFSVPACWDIGGNVGPFQQLVLTSSGWQHVLTDAPDALSYGSVVDGPASFRSLLDTSLQTMDEFRQDGASQSGFDAISSDYATVAALINADPGQTYSFVGNVAADECSESSAIFFDAVTRIAIVLHIPPRC